MIKKIIIVLLIVFVVYHSIGQTGFEDIENNKICKIYSKQENIDIKYINNSKFYVINNSLFLEEDLFVNCLK